MPTPFIANPASLSVLQRLQGLSNVGSLGKRGLDVASGLDDLGPTDGELEDQQNQDASQGEATTGYGFSDSKENLRDEAMQKLKRTLMMSDMESRAKQAEAAAPKRIEGEYGLEKARIDNAGQAALRASEVGKNDSEAARNKAGASLTERLMGQSGGGSSTSGAPSIGGSEMRPRVDANGQVSFTGVAAPKMSATATTPLIALNQFRKLGPKILARLEQQYPGIDTNPEKFGGAEDTLLSKVKSMAYKSGMVSAPNSLQNDEVSQIEELARIVGARGYMQGRPSQQIFDVISSHLPSMTNSPGANYSRVKQLLSTVPDMEQGISEVEDPNYLETLRKQNSTSGSGLADPHGLR